jgi:hypothetical protein
MPVIECRLIISRNTISFRNSVKFISFFVDQKSNRHEYCMNQLSEVKQLLKICVYWFHLKVYLFKKKVKDRVLTAQNGQFLWAICFLCMGMIYVGKALVRLQTDSSWSPCSPPWS